MPAAGTPALVTLYAGPTEAAKAVHEDYLYWTGKLTDTSFQLSVAVIAANWAVFGSTQHLLANTWSKLSISVVILSVGTSLLGAKIMSELHRKRLEYAESDPARWKEEFDAAHGRSDPWPYTRVIEALAFLFRWCKTWLPLAGGALFLAGVAAS